MEELKKCPFCGGEAEFIRSVYSRDWKVSCAMSRTCYVIPSTDFFETKEEAVIAWNRRVE